MEISLFLGVLIGMVMGVTGAGGGVLAVPALVNGMGWSMQQAAPVALIAVALGASLGTLEGWRKGLVRYRAALLMVCCGLPFAFGGVAVAYWLPQRWLQALFACVLVIVAVRLIRQTRADWREDIDKKLARIDPETGRFGWSWVSGALFAGIGALAGFMAGLLGVGGGFVIVPALRRFTDVTMHAAVATSLMVIALVGGGSVLAALGQGARLPHPETLLFAAATALGVGLGRKLSPRLSEKTVQRAFAIVLLVSAGSMALKAALSH